MKEIKGFINSLEGIDQIGPKTPSYTTSRNENFLDQLDIDRASSEGMAQNNYVFEKEAATARAQIKHAKIESPRILPIPAYPKPGEVVYLSKN